MTKKPSKFIYLIAAFSGLGGFLFGYDTGVISGALLFLKSDFALTTFQQEIVVASLLFFAAIGALIAGRLADKIGRRPTIISAGLCFVIGAICMSAAPGFLTLVIGRTIVGLAIGIASMTVPLYVSELSPSEIRGLCVSINQLLVTIGIVVAYVIDLSFAPSGGWRWMLGLSIVPASILVLAMFFLPETPRFLMRKRREKQARTVFEKLGITGKKADTTIERIQSNLKTEKGGLKELFSKRLRIPLMIGMLLAILQQITGINTVIYYAPVIFQTAGFTGDISALIATSVVGVTNVLMTIVALALIDRIGRRPLLIWGTIAMVLGLFLLGFDWLLPNNLFKGYIAIGSLMVYIAGFAIGLGPIAWLILAELYPLRIRGTAMSLGAFVNWFFNFLVALTFLNILQAIGPTLTFWLYGALSLLTIVFVYFFVPETKGKTLEQTESFWK